jgi:hypothetical protein
MIVDNALLSSFTPRFEATPALSQAEIFSVLGQNITGISNGQADQSKYLSATTDVLSQFSLVRRLQRQIRDFLNLDMLSIRTQILQNWIFESTGIKTPVDRVGNYLDNTSVFIGKYLGSNVFIQGMVAFRYDSARKSQTWLGVEGLALEPDVSLEMRTPLFNIGVSLAPLHPQYWFINDISIALAWRWTF